MSLILEDSQQLRETMLTGLKNTEFAIYALNWVGLGNFTMNFLNDSSLRLYGAYWFLIVFWFGTNGFVLVMDWMMRP
jgi:hypothetical protein